MSLHDQWVIQLEVLKTTKLLLREINAAPTPPKIKN